MFRRGFPVCSLGCLSIVHIRPRRTALLISTLIVGNAAGNRAFRHVHSTLKFYQAFGRTSALVPCENRNSICRQWLSFFQNVGFPAFCVVPDCPTSGRNVKRFQDNLPLHQTRRASLITNNPLKNSVCGTSLRNEGRGFPASHALRSSGTCHTLQCRKQTPRLAWTTPICENGSAYTKFDFTYARTPWQDWLISTVPAASAAT